MSSCSALGSGPCWAAAELLGGSNSGAERWLPRACRELSTQRLLVMEWIDGVRCTDPAGIKAAGIDVDEFIRVGVVSGAALLFPARPVCFRCGPFVSGAALFAPPEPVGGRSAAPSGRA